MEDKLCAMAFTISCKHPNDYVSKCWETQFIDGKSNKRQCYNRKSNLTRNHAKLKLLLERLWLHHHPCLSSTKHDFMTVAVLRWMRERERERERVWCCACRGAHWLPLANFTAGLTLGHGLSPLPGSGLRFGPTEPPNFGIRPRRYSTQGNISGSFTETGPLH